MLSEVARIKEAIELECVSMLIMNSFSYTGGHTYIEKKFKNIDRERDKLAKLIGDEQATGTTVDIYNDLMRGL